MHKFHISVFGQHGGRDKFDAWFPTGNAPNLVDVANATMDGIRRHCLGDARNPVINVNNQPDPFDFDDEDRVCVQIRDEIGLLLTYVTYWKDDRIGPLCITEGCRVGIVREFNMAACDNCTAIVPETRHVCDTCRYS